MWKPAITNGYLRLKMWKKCGRRRNGNRKCYGTGNKYDDRIRFLGYVPQETQFEILCQEKQNED